MVKASAPGVDLHPAGKVRFWAARGSQILREDNSPAVSGRPLSQAAINTVPHTRWAAVL